MLSVSIITPSLNQGRFLERTVRSVLADQPDQLQHIVIDGASTDNTLEILGRYEEHLQWISEPDNGQASAVNKGIQRASGEIIGWLNSDDLYYSGTIPAVRSFFSARPDVDVLYADGNYIDEDDEIIKPFPARNWSSRRLRRKSFLCQPAVFFRRRVLHRCGLLDERWHYWMDYEYWLRLVENRCVFAHLPKTLAAVRVHPENKTVGNPSGTNRLEAAAEIIKITSERFGRIPTRLLLNYGRAVASDCGLSPDCSRKYDSTVISAAREARQRWQAEAGPSRSFETDLLLRHIVKELEHLVRYPIHALRFAPGSLQHFIKVNLKRRIFKLRHHEPRNLKVPPVYVSASPDATMPLVSVVTPNLNQGEFLEETILSVLQQGYRKLQYIIQDGGSTDGSLNVIRRYEDQLASWESAPDRGQAHAINLGMQNATGEIMAYLNSDDILLPGSLSYVADFFRQHPEVDVVYGHRVLIDADGREVGRWVLPPHDDKVLPWADYIPQETMFWRRGIWEKVGRQLDESFQFAMDWDLILRFREAGAKFVRLGRFLGAFRITEDQKTQRLIETVGQSEMNRLRRRVLGRRPRNDEIRRVIRPYLRRHWVFDKLYQLGVAKY